MPFAHPALLLLLLAPPLARLWPRRRAASAPFPDVRLLEAAGGGGRHPSAWVLPLLRLLAGMLLALAAAGPLLPGAAPVRRDGVALALVLDVSGSMAEPLPGGRRRLDAARAALRRFLDDPARTGDQVALVAFAAEPDALAPPTLDREAVRLLLDRQDVRPVEGEASNLGDALALALARLDAVPGRRKAIILASDGEQNVRLPGATIPAEAAALAASLGVPVHAVDCGGDVPAGAPPERAAQRRDGREMLRQLASATGGAFAETADAAAERVGAMERGAADGLGRGDRTAGRLVAALAAFLLALELALRRGWWNVQSTLPGVAAPAAARGGVLAPLGWSLLFTGLAGPTWGTRPSGAVAEGRDVVITVDISRSMQADDGDGPTRRWQVAAASARSLVAALRPGDRAAVVAFAARPTLLVPPTLDRPYAGEVLRDLQPAALWPRVRPDAPDAGSGTRLGAGLAAAAGLVSAPFAAATDIILLSDGDDPAAGREWEAGVAASRAAGVPVHVVAVGDPARASALPDVSPEARTRPDEAKLREIAARTGGDFLPARRRPLDLGAWFLANRAGAGRRVLELEPSATPAEASGPLFAAALLLFLMARRGE